MAVLNPIYCYTYLATTYLQKKVDYLLKNNKLWPLIVYKSKQAKPGKRYFSNMLQIRSVCMSRGYQITLALSNTVIKARNIGKATNYNYLNGQKSVKVDYRSKY